MWPSPLHKNCGVLTSGPPGSSSLLVSFIFYCPRRHSSRCKHCSKGSQVPACLNSSSPDLTTTIICLDIAMPSKTINFSWQDSRLSSNCLYNVWTSSYHLFVLKSTYQMNVVWCPCIYFFHPPFILCTEDRGLLNIFKKMCFETLKFLGHAFFISARNSINITFP